MKEQFLTHDFKAGAVVGNAPDHEVVTTISFKGSRRGMSVGFRSASEKSKVYPHNVFRRTRTPAVCGRLFEPRTQS
jgi:hypothetical protein